MAIRKEKALEFAKKYQVSNFDTLIIEPDENRTGSIGIDQIRDLKTKLNLRPFNSKVKLAILVSFERATHEAQNAFLKTLEEPPSNTIIVLTSQNTDLLLPTLVSRCQVIQLPTANYQLLTTELSTVNSQLSTLFKAGIGERLKFAQEISKTRDDAILWFEKMIIFLRQALINSLLENKRNILIPSYINYLKSFQKNHTLLSTTNVSVRFTMEICLLNL